jgi:hypothetical protein
MSLKVSGQLREKNMRASKPSRVKNQVADQNLLMAINVQRGNRIIVIDTFFAIPFSDLFRMIATPIFCARSITSNHSSHQRKHLTNERIDDRIAQTTRATFVS